MPSSQSSRPASKRKAVSKDAGPTRARKKASTPEPSASKDVWTLRLYVAGDSPKSKAAIANLKRLCDAHLHTKYEIEVVDLKLRPELAKADQILALPTLIRRIPEPMKRVIGDLSNAERALLGLDLNGTSAGPVTK